ncbi:unnamed protein product [Adineta ricciae]|uniref:F-box domain-containing protein n=1 Tax=Adineta ricciae TaxID=249248 RepID=A0A815UKK0_ADIRI|nr:unnamed protein product [Adineta ricciae]
MDEMKIKRFKTLSLAVKNNFTLLPNELLLNIFEYLSSWDLVRAFDQHSLQFGPPVTYCLVKRGMDLSNIQSSDVHLLPSCLSFIKKQYLNICVNEQRLCLLLTYVPMPRTLICFLDMSLEKSFFFQMLPASLSCQKLILQCKSTCQRCINIDEILLLLSTSVQTLFLVDILCIVNQQRLSQISCIFSIQHLQCTLKTEDDLCEILKLIPSIIFIDIKLLFDKSSQSYERLSLPRNYRIEYPRESLINLNRFPSYTKMYDQTLYSLPWFSNNSSLTLHSCRAINYQESFSNSLPMIHQLTIQCSFEPWLLDFVIFLRQTFPNLQTLRTIQSSDNRRRIVTIITTTDRKLGRCTMY